MSLKFACFWECAGNSFVNSTIPGRIRITRNFFCINFAKSNLMVTFTANFRAGSQHPLDNGEVKREPFEILHEKFILNLL